MATKQTTQDKSAEAFFFDDFALRKKWDAFTKEGSNKLLSEFLRVVQPKNTERLLDLGCGTGSFSKDALASVQTLIGLDISFVSIAVAAEDVPGAQFVMADIEHIPFPDDSFDIVVHGAVLHHFPNIQGVLRESFRVLRTDGRCFAYDPNLHNVPAWFYRNAKLPLRLDKYHTVNERLLGAEEVRTELINAGFRAVVVRAVSGVTYEAMWAKSNLTRWGLMFFNLFDKLLDKTPLAKKFGSFLISFATK